MMMKLYDVVSLGVYREREEEGGDDDEVGPSDVSLFLFPPAINIITFIGDVYNELAIRIIAKI